MDKKLMELTKTHNITLKDMTDIGKGYGIEIAEKIVGNSGFNPCVPTRLGKSIYQGAMAEFIGRDFDDCIKQALDYIRDCENGGTSNE